MNTQGAPARALATPPPARQLALQLATLQPAPAREPERQLASLQAPAPLPSAEPSLPQAAQGSANDPIRELISRSEPAPARSETLHRLEPAGSSGGWGAQAGAFSSQDKIGR